MGSAENEDVLIEKALIGLGLNNGIRYLDIGASHPSICSNTRYFYDKGFSGVLVEPLLWNIELIKAERPRDVLVEGVVCPDDRPFVEFRIIGGHGGGSTIRDCVIPDSKKHIHPTPYRINNILRMYFPDKPPSFMSMDIEGWELRVLQDMYFDAYPIPVVCIEHERHPEGAIDTFMFGKGYKIVAKTRSNTIYATCQ